MGFRRIIGTAIAAILMGIVASCATTASTYRASSLRISIVPNQNSETLAQAHAPKIEEVLNQAFMADGRFKAGTGLYLSVEVTRLDLPRSKGTQEFNDRFGPGYTFLPGILVVAARWYDDHQKLIEQAEYAEDIMPAPGEVNSYAAFQRSIDAVTKRIMDDTMRKYYARGN